MKRSAIKYLFSLFIIIGFQYIHTQPVKANPFNNMPTIGKPGSKSKSPSKKKEPRYRGFQNNTGSKYRYSRKDDMLVKRSLPGRVLFRLVHPFNRYGHRMV